MAWAFSVQVIDLYIKQYANGTTTFIDQNGQQYIPLEQQLSGTQESEGIVNTNIDIERAIIFAAISLGLVLLGGITSGLNVSLLSIDAKKSKLMLKLSEKNSALIPKAKLIMMEKLQPLIDDRHLLLVTLLVANASCMEALPIFLDELVASWLAIVISVTFVLIFGEILPQALFTADPLKSGYKLYYLVFFMKFLFYPICKPLAFLLDLLFGEEHEQKGVTFTQQEVSMIMMEIQQHPDERTVVEGALKIANYTVMESIIPWNDVICFDANSKLDAGGLRAIYKTGFSRIPIYENRKDNVIGILLVKTLILCDPDPELTLKQYLTYNFRKVPTPQLVQPKTALYDCINLFQENKTHFAMVCQKEDTKIIQDCWRDREPIPDRIVWAGIITLEDIMEDIIQEEIADEFDAQSPLQAILEASKSSLGFGTEEKKSQWTDEQAFVESVKSRFVAKNKRTLRAKQMKTKRRSFKKLHLPQNSAFSDTETTSPLAFPVDDGMSIFDQSKPGSQSHPSLLSKPLLSANDTSVNVKVNAKSLDTKQLPKVRSSPDMEYNVPFDDNQ